MSKPTVIDFECNGEPVRVGARDDTLLLHVLRDQLSLTATKLGCGTGDCGSCTVLVDGRPVNSCLVYAVECDGARVVTPESLEHDPVGRLVIDELVARGGVQCGICTPGIVALATAAIASAPGPLDREEISDALAGNLCRCTGYYPIAEAVRVASERATEKAR
jgi:carbon-monoxide dehydrogenase small subunit